MKAWAWMVACAGLFAAAWAHAADRHYGPGNNAAGNWSANNWYTAQTGGTLTNAPGIEDRAVIVNGDQVHLDVDPVIADLLMTTAGGSQPVRLTNSAPRLLTVTNRVTLQTAFGSSGLLGIDGGTVTTRFLRLQAATGNTAGHGTFTANVGTGRLYVADNVDVVSGTNFSSGASTFTLNTLAGLIQVNGNLSTTGFSAQAVAAGSRVNWQFNDSASAFGRLVVGGSADFSNSIFLVETETFAGGNGTYNIVSAGTWARGFDEYRIRTVLGVSTVLLSQTVSAGGKDYSLVLTGGSLDLVIADTPVISDRHYGPGTLAVGNWSSNNWYDAATGGNLTNAPGLSNRARIESGDQVTLDVDAAVDGLLMTTAGAAQPTRLIWDSAARSLRVANTSIVQTTFGSSGALQLNGGAMTTKVLRLQAATGNTDGRGSFAVNVAGGRLHITQNLDALSGTNFPGSSTFNVNVTGGVVQVDGNASTAGFQHPTPKAVWRFSDAAGSLGAMTVGGSVNLTNSSVIVESFVLGTGVYAVVSAGAWTKPFDSYTIATTGGAAVVSLGDVVTNGTLTYSLTLNATTLSLTIGSAIPPAPDVAVMGLQIAGTNLVIRSTGTNTWSAGLEYTTNLLASPQVWLPLATTNTYADGTNTTTAVLPAVSPVIIRALNQYP